MSFLHAYLLGGMALVAAPILIHLVTREKPKHLLFPAFRFLAQKYHTNRRKLRLHHLLLLLLRMLLIAALCFALARPRLHSDLPIFLGGTQPVEVVLVVDASRSMEYERGELTRLADARRRAAELLEELPPESRIALLDSAEIGGQFENLSAIPQKLKDLKIRSANYPVSRLLDRAYKLFAEADELRESGTDAPPRYLYIFSDRTRASWDSSAVKGLTAPEGVNIVYVDVGAEKPIDLAIEQVVIDPMAVPLGGQVQVSAIVLATGEKADRKITCQIDNNPRLQEKIVQIEPGSRKAVTFEFRAASMGPDGQLDDGLAPGPHQLVIRLEGPDRLPFNNVHHATFVVRPGRKVLTLMDDVSEPQPWPIALDVLGFASVVKPMRDAGALKLKDLKEYDLVCLHQVANPAALWSNLRDYVWEGGKLAIIPGGTLDRASYNDDETAKKLLPGSFTTIATASDGAGIPWDWEWSKNNPATLMAPFVRWKLEQSDLEFWKGGGEPRVLRYWLVNPADRARVITRYKDVKASPAILEREVHKGKVLLFTTKMDVKTETIFAGVGPRRWHNYWDNSFGLILADKACRYLVGDSVAPDWNYIAGAKVLIPLPREGADQYILKGPGLSPQGAPLTPPGQPADAKEPVDTVLPITPGEVGNYVVQIVRNQRTEVLEAFSVNVRPDESILDPRIPKEEIEEVLGKDTVLDLEHNLSLRDAISRKPQPLELLPYLMLLLLVFLAVENLIANRRREKPPPDAQPATSPIEKVAFSWRPVLLLVFWTLLGVILGATVGFLRGGVSMGLAAGAFVTGLLGMFHGFLSLAPFGPRDRAILGALLGSMIGVLNGWLVLGLLMGFDGMVAVMLGMLLGAGLMALDGWLLGLRAGPAQVRGGQA